MGLTSSFSSSSSLPLDFRREKLLSKGSHSFSLDWFKWVYETFDRREGPPPGNGRTELEEAIYDCDLVRLAAFQGSLEALRWLRSRDPPSFWDERACSFSAFGGQLEVLQWLRKEGCPWSARTCNAAAYSGVCMTQERGVPVCV